MAGNTEAGGLEGVFFFCDYNGQRLHGSQTSLAAEGEHVIVRPRRHLRDPVSDQQSQPAFLPLGRGLHQDAFQYYHQR